MQSQLSHSKEILHDHPVKHSKLAYADDVTVTGTLRELKILWNMCDLGPKFGYYPQVSKSWLFVKNRIKRASILF